jgi:hypothetical protein
MTLRDKYRADVVVLIVDDAAGCGLATRVFADAEDAFAVVHHECSASFYSLASSAAARGSSSKCLMAASV